MSTRSSPGLMLSAVILAACAGKTPPPAIAYDSKSFVPAVAVVEDRKSVV